MKRPLNPELGRRIQQTRELKDIAREVLGQKIGRHYTYIYKIEQNGYVPRREVLLKIAEALDIGSARTKEWLSIAGREGVDTLAPPSREDTASAEDAKQAEPSAELVRTAFGKAIRYLPRRAAADLVRLETDVSGIIDMVFSEWECKPEVADIPRHGPSHNARMTDILFESFMPELRELSIDELRALFAAVWLHDIGLAAPDAKERLSDYELFSVEYADEHDKELGLMSPDMLRAVSILCLYHRNTTSIEDLKIGDRQKAMVALLRLADLMDVRAQRVKGRHLETVKEIPRDLVSDVIRSQFVRHIRVDRKECKLWADVYSDKDWGNPMLDLLQSLVKHDLKTALDRISAQLNRELGTHLFWADIKDTVPPANKQESTRLAKMLDRLRTARSPNAERVFASIVSSLDERLNAGGFDLDTERQVRDDLDYYEKLRSAHQQIRNIATAFKEILDVPGSGEQKVGAMRALLAAYKESQLKAYTEIRRWAKETFKTATRFLLFGLSNSVLEAFAELIEDVRSSSYVYVCECRNKTLFYEMDNSVEFCDGVEYARRVSGLKYANVKVISDVSVTHYMSSPESEAERAMKTCVLLGADGIDLSGDVSGTIGSATVALSARHSKVDVYVLAEEGKVGVINWTELGGRDNSWLATDTRITRVLKNARIEIGKPGNECVPSSLIHKFITESGPESAKQFGSRAHTLPGGKVLRQSTPSHRPRH